MTEHFDVLVIGAGLSGIGAAYHLQTRCPNKTYAILEGRENLGGTWDLFRYPGIRSDSDMFTLGYSFKPWTCANSIADASDILTYLRETVEENAIEPHIRFKHQVKSAAWSSEDNRWTLEIVRSNDNNSEEEIARFTCNFLFSCAGYYNYEAGYTPDFKGTERFAGRIVHPQHWTDDIRYAGKKVVVIGSGATAVTLVPELAKDAEHVTMLQRSPTYIVSGPAKDPLVSRLRRYLPEPMVHFFARWKNIFIGMLSFWWFRKFPKHSKSLIMAWARQQLGADFDVNQHFNPSYNPWDERVCLAPNGDLFHAIREGTASVMTDHIDTFTEKGLLLKSGEELEADLIVTATGLNMQLITDSIPTTIDGKTVNGSDHWIYKGMMLSDVPNMAFAMGYTNASWTLKVDLTCQYMCRLLNHMQRHDYQRCVARRNDSKLREEVIVNFTSGYVQRALKNLPKQGSKHPWKLYQNYVRDLLTLGFGRLGDKVMEFR
jgi:monooxygenase